MTARCAPLALALLLLTVAPVSAANANISMVYCVDAAGGSQRVPAATRLVVMQHWGAKTAGNIRQFRKNVTMRASIDGKAIPDANRFFGPAYYNGNDGFWKMTWTYKGPVIRRQTVVVRTQLDFRRPTSDGWDTFSGPQVELVCRVSA